MNNITINEDKRSLKVRDEDKKYGYITGRPILLNKELIDRFFEDLKNGLTVELASAKNGICYSTFYNWQRTAKNLREAIENNNAVEITEESELYLEFLQAIERGRALFAERNMLLIQVAAQKSWQAAAWSLERRFPREYGRLYNEVAVNGKFKVDKEDDINIEEEMRKRGIPIPDNSIDDIEGL